MFFKKKRVKIDVTQLEYPAVSLVANLFFSQKSYLKCVVINIAKIKTNHLIGERLTGLHQKSRCAAVSTCDSL